LVTVSRPRWVKRIARRLISGIVLAAIDRQALAAIFRQ
jgi:hypothetical protein